MHAVLGVFAQGSLLNRPWLSARLNTHQTQGQDNCPYHGHQQRQKEDETICGEPTKE